LKRYIIYFLKFAVPAAIIAWLLASVPADDYRAFQARPKNWPLLGLALLVVLSAVSVTIVRWYLLVRALGLRFRLVDAFRLGYLGYLLNFVSVGSVGGDLFKAIFIAREQPGRRAEAVATVLVDRIVGMYGLVLLTSGVICLGGIPNADRDVVAICRLTLLVAVVGLAGIIVWLIPGSTSGRWWRWLTDLPKVGPILRRLLDAAEIYRSRWLTVASTLVISMFSHALFTLSIFLIAHAMFAHVPSLREHLIIVPLGMVAGSLPMTPAGFGAFEFAIEKLYQMIPVDPLNDVAGILVALVYRVLTILVAMIGIVVYWTSQREMQAALHEAEQESHTLE
jgi:uncharacterized protein (TIRG00374 family)